VRAFGENTQFSSEEVIAGVEEDELKRDVLEGALRSGDGRSAGVRDSEESDGIFGVVGVAELLRAVIAFKLGHRGGETTKFIK
jgi:hypothetical protein